MLNEEEEAVTVAEENGNIISNDDISLTSSL
jgi:hypothetical protein